MRLGCLLRLFIEILDDRWKLLLLSFEIFEVNSEATVIIYQDIFSLISPINRFSSWNSYSHQLGSRLRLPQTFFLGWVFMGNYKSYFTEFLNSFDWCKISRFLFNPFFAAQISFKLLLQLRFLSLMICVSVIKLPPLCVKSQNSTWSQVLWWLLTDSLQWFMKKGNIVEFVNIQKSGLRAYVSLMMPCDKIFSYPIKIWISQEFWN